MEKRIILTAGIFLLLSFFVANTYGDGCSGTIRQPVQTPAAGQAYLQLKKVELWLVHNPDSISNREVRAVIDGKEIALSLKNVTFYEIWKTSAEIWAANISLSNGEHTCQYFYVQSVKQSNGFWADFHVQTTNPFKFYIVGEEQTLPILDETQTQVEEAAKNDLAETSNLNVKAVSIYLLLAAALGACIVKTRSKLTNRIKCR